MESLLVIDVGNTNTVLGLYQGEDLRAQWRVETNGNRTADEYAVILQQLMALEDIAWGEISAAIVSSVLSNSTVSNSWPATGSPERSRRDEQTAVFGIQDPVQPG